MSQKNKERICKNSKKILKNFEIMIMAFETSPTDKTIYTHFILIFTENFTSLSSITAEKIPFPQYHHGLTDGQTNYRVASLLKLITQSNSLISISSSPFIFPFFILARFFFSSARSPAISTSNSRLFLSTTRLGILKTYAFWI